jgi:lysozyme family protein
MKGAVMVSAWDRLKVRGPDLPWPLSLAVFDAAVNLGLVESGKILQAPVNALRKIYSPAHPLYLKQDGIVGDKTVEVGESRREPDAVRECNSLNGGGNGTERSSPEF